MEPIVVADGLVKRYGSKVAVDGVSFTVSPGEVFAVLGPNGAGKTTTVEILEGFRRPDGGRVSVLGCNPRRDRRRLVPRIGVMPQEGGVWGGIRAEEALRLFASYYEQPQDPDALLTGLGLDGVRRTTYRRLSGGEKQRLSLALALVGRPEIAFLDEPTAGMDPRGRATTWQVVSDLHDHGTTVVLTTHLLEEAERLADRVAIIHQGRVVACGPPRELVTKAVGAEIRFRTAPGLDTNSLTGVLGSSVAEDAPGSYRLVGAEATPEMVARLTRWLADRDVLLNDLVIGRRSLEEVFLELTREEA